jgi:hypothetical protein
MSDEWRGYMKMRGSIWSVLVGLAVGIAAYIWSGTHQDPVFKLYRDCESREWDQRKIFSRPPAPIMKEIDEKCRWEMQSHLIPDGQGGWKIKP